MFRVLVLSVLLVGCASTRTGCLPMRVYSVEEEQALAAAIVLLEPEGVVVHALEDYSALRASNRACLGK